MRTPFMKYAVAGAAALSLVAGGAVVAQAALTKNPAEVTSGTYDLDSGHGKITWSVNHFGLSTYTGQFVNVKAELEIELLHAKIDALREQEIARLTAIIEKLSDQLAAERQG